MMHNGSTTYLVASTQQTGYVVASQQHLLLPDRHPLQDRILIAFQIDVQYGTELEKKVEKLN